MKNSRVFDCFTFFNELDLLELRLQTLWDLVDHFVLVEANRTFTGKPKPYVFSQNAERFARYLDKIIHVKVEDMPNIGTAWDREHHQRNCIERGLKAAQPDDLIIVSDVDEIVKPQAMEQALPVANNAITIFVREEFNFKLNLKAHRVKLNKGACMIEWKHFQSAQALRDVRARKSYSLPPPIEKFLWTYDAFRTHWKIFKRNVVPNGAWHFSFLMDPELIRTKMAAYAHVERNKPEQLTDGSIQTRIAQMTSMHGEPMELVNISYLPRPVVTNRSAWEQFLFDPASTR